MKTHYLLLFLLLPFLGYSQCPANITDNGTRLFLNYANATDLMNAQAVFGNSPTLTYNSMTYTLQSQPGSLRYRVNPAAAAGTFSDSDIGLVSISISTLTGAVYTCNYEDGALVSFVLPVKLASFEVEQREGEVVLKWQTTSEVNNEYFEVERSIGGNDFTSLGFVDGNTNSTRLIDYSFVDNKAGSGQIYYRLKQVDLDGRYEYSEVVSIRIQGGNDIKLFPTVINKGALLNVVSDEQLSFKVYTPSMQLVELDVQNGSTINTDNLSSGVYSVLFSNGVAKRFIVVE